MRKIASLVIVYGLIVLTGCVSIEAINSKILPVNKWYEQEYEETRFTQRYKFTKTDVDAARRGIVTSASKFGMTITSSAEDVVATGNPTTMFTTDECEAWKSIDEERTKQLSGGMIGLTCDASNNNSIILETIKLKRFLSGTLIVLDYETMNPTFEAYGLLGPRRPPPAASKAGSSKFWNIINQSFPYPVRDVTKEDLQ